SNVLLINQKYSSIKTELNQLGIEKIDGLMLDLGISSHQLDTRERGFSYHGEAPLDMRMSQTGISAQDIVNTYSAKELANIFFIYADEKFSFKIADKIVETRKTNPITTTTQLADLVSECYPNKFKRNGHPARKVFQALRIAVNDEMGEVEKGIKDAFSMLNSGGRLSVITFHSIEDRLVKQLFSSFTQGCTCPPDFPVCVCNKKPKAKLINRKPIIASDEELENNQRSRSAKLRILEKL
ncbi:MAG: 16S rRNA (cytosine(1402)-N(4))-methyltransferase RsmH, partial [Clostridia bacterium]|nr:16S rRNA (cytosine(1402)-N(4))-methyltransferase RsmH [Clostridia bacterium]